MASIRKITITRKSDNINILDAQAVEELEINFYDKSIDLEFRKDNITYTMNIKESNNYKILIE